MDKNSDHEIRVIFLLNKKVILTTEYLSLAPTEPLFILHEGNISKLVVWTIPIDNSLNDIAQLISSVERCSPLSISNQIIISYVILALIIAVFVFLGLIVFATCFPLVKSGKLKKMVLKLANPIGGGSNESYELLDTMN